MVVNYSLGACKANKKMSEVQEEEPVNAVMKIPVKEKINAVLTHTAEDGNDKREEISNK